MTETIEAALARDLHAALLASVVAASEHTQWPAGVTAAWRELSGNGRAVYERAAGRLLRKYRITPLGTVAVPDIPQAIDFAEDVAIERAPVASSNVAEIGYSDQRQVLEVRFRSGQTYRYAGVPAHVWRDLRATESTGTFLAGCIRGRYPHLKLPTPEAP